MLPSALLVTINGKQSQAVLDHWRWDDNRPMCTSCKEHVRFVFHAANCFLHDGKQHLHVKTRKPLHIPATSAHAVMHCLKTAVRLWLKGRAGLAWAGLAWAGLAWAGLGRSRLLRLHIIGE